MPNAAPLIAGNWYFQANFPLPDTSTAQRINDGTMFMLVQMLKGGTTVSGSSQTGSYVNGVSGSLSRPASTLWSVVGSCDGVLGALDGVDRLTGSVSNSWDSTKWVHAASGTAHSWIVMQSPAALGPVYMCIDANSATTNIWGVIFSKTGFVITPAPATGSRPLTNQGWAMGISVDPVATSNTQIQTDNTLASVYRANIAVDSSGAWHFFTSRNATGLPNLWMSCFATVDTIPGDTSWNVFCAFDNSTTANKGSPAWSNVGATTTRVMGRTFDGSTFKATGGFCEWQFGATQTAANGGSDVFSGSTGNFRVFPPYIYDLTAGKNCWRGRMPDTWVVGSLIAGTQFPSASFTQLVFGDLLIPFTLSASF